jgi:hypothetical protein
VDYDSLNPQGWAVKPDPLAELGTDDDGIPMIEEVDDLGRRIADGQADGY